MEEGSAVDSEVLSVHGGTSVDMDVVGEEVPQKEETEVDEYEEILPDGTVHHTRRVRTQAFKVMRSVKSLDGEEEVVEEKEIVPGSLREDIVETFDEPPRMVREAEDVEDVLDDGTKVHKKVIYSRMIHRMRTHQESFDSDHGRQTEDFEIDEVIPGTESAFIAADTSESEGSDDEMGHYVKDTEENREPMDRSFTPSPRSHSPVEADLYDRQAISTTTSSAPVEEVYQVEQSQEVTDDMMASGAIISESEQQQAVTSADRTRSGDPSSWDQDDEGYPQGKNLVGHA